MEYTIIHNNTTKGLCDLHSMAVPPRCILPPQMLGNLTGDWGLLRNIKHADLRRHGICKAINVEELQRSAVEIILDELHAGACPLSNCVGRSGSDEDKTKQVWTNPCKIMASTAWGEVVHRFYI